MKASLEIAEKAKAFARSKKIMGSNNKFHSAHPNRREEWDRIKAAGTRRMGNLDEFWKIVGEGDWTIEGLKDLAWSCIMSGTGNCMELAAISFLYLVDEQVDHVWYMCLEPPGDHAFIALGNIQGNPAKLHKWGPDVFICDPWANIACKSGEFRDKWYQKMDKWDSAGKMLPGGFTPGKGTYYVSPLREDWYFAIEDHKFKVLMEHHS